MQTKRSELDEKNELFEVTQERVFQLSAELEALRAGPDETDKSTTIYYLKYENYFYPPPPPPQINVEIPSSPKSMINAKK